MSYVFSSPWIYFGIILFMLIILVAVNEIIKSIKVNSVTNQTPAELISVALLKSGIDFNAVKEGNCVIFYIEDRKYIRFSRDGYLIDIENIKEESNG